ncbi:MAG: YegP family protein [Acetobacter sp.]|nr:YegP family protein [Acetobacter sp.]
MYIKYKVDKFRFYLKVDNGEAILVNEGYKQQAGALYGVEAVKKTAPEAMIKDQTKI